VTEFKVRVSGFGVSGEMNERDKRGNEGGKRESGYGLWGEKRTEKMNPPFSFIFFFLYFCYCYCYYYCYYIIFVLFV